MRITLQITCDNEAEAQTIIRKITAPPTWVDELEKTNPAPRTTEARVDKIMGSSVPQAAEQSGSNNGATDAPRPNINPGDPTITKLGTATKELVLTDLAAGRQLPQPKYTEHLKLLWSRGLIKFDGTQYYL